MKIRNLNQLGGIVLLLLLITACSKVPELPPLSQNAKILAFGDELTLAAHLPVEQSYVGKLQKHLNRTVINAGKAGEKLQDAALRLPSVLEAEKPGLVILMHGGYALGQTDKEGSEIIDLFRQMLNAAQQHKVPVLLVGMPENGPYLAPPKFYRQLASAFDVPYHGGVLSKVLATQKYLSPNGLPNEAGYQLIADGMIELLGKAKAIPEPE